MSCLDGIPLDGALIYFHWMEAAPGHLVQMANPTGLEKPPVIGMRCSYQQVGGVIDSVLLLDGENAGVQAGHQDIPAPAIDVTNFVQIQVQRPVPLPLAQARLNPGSLYAIRGSQEVYVLMRGAKLMCVLDPTGKNTGRKLEMPNIDTTMYLGDVVLTATQR
jgi:hypothetical protein